MKERLYFTEKGIEKLRKEIEELTKKLTELQSQTAYVAEVGGDQYHDNASYETLTIDIRGIDRRLTDAHYLLNKAIIVNSPKDASRVAIGVRVKILRDNKESTWKIGGFAESDPGQKIIAYDTSLASLLIGKMKGEIIDGVISGKHTKIEIIEITIGGDNENEK